MLFFPAESFPTNRVRLTALFGREMFGRGHAIDLVMQAGTDAVRPGRHDWFGRSVWVGPTDCRGGFLNRLHKHALGFSHDLRLLFRARASDYDCILVSDKYLLACIASVIARVRGLKFFFWLTFSFHNSYILLGREGLARYPLLSRARGHVASFFLRHWIIPLSHHVFVQSPRMAEDFCDYGANPTRLTPILTGVDTAEAAPVGREAGRRRVPLTIAYLGTLGRERRIEILVDMVAELKRQGLSVRLLLVGDGETAADRAAIELRAQALGVLNQIEITGLLPRLQAMERASTADIGISPIPPSPIFDGASPTKLVEYLALGLPVIANSHPDQSQVLRDSGSGVCVPWGPRYFARAVRWMARLSDEQFATFGQRGRTWVREHRSYTKIADEFERACVRAIEKGTRVL